MDMKHKGQNLVVFDIGGTAVKYGLWDGKNLLKNSSFPTPSSFVKLAAQMKLIIEGFSPVQGVAISSPGAVNSITRRIEGVSAVPYLHNRPIFDELEEMFNLPVSIENDANCAGICEIDYGAGKEAQNAVFIVIGTGVGGAIFINRRLYKGSHLFAGEFGLMKDIRNKTFSETGPLVKAAELYQKETGKKISGKELFELKDRKDSFANLLIENMMENISDYLYNIQVSLDPDTIVVGGGMSARDDLATVLQEKLFERLENNDVAKIMPKIYRCQYLNNANLIGAALNFKNYFENGPEII
jgi:predicted NBD/HSP70 family sugar kinase